MSNYWGYHLALDVAGADLEKISSHEHIQAFARDLVKRIDMVAYGEPQTVRFGSGNKEGITLVQLIETSNIMCHFVEDDGNNDGKGSYYLDVFSCKTYDIETVIQCCREYFGNSTERVHYFVRHAD